MQSNQMNNMGRMPMPLMSQPMQPPPGMHPPGMQPPGMQPPGLLPPQSQQQQPPPNLGGMGQMPSISQQQNQGMIRGWQPQQNQVSQPPSILSLNTAPTSSGSMGKEQKCVMEICSKILWLQLLFKILTTKLNINFVRTALSSSIPIYLNIYVLTVR